MPDLTQLSHMDIYGTNVAETVRMLQDAYIRMRKDLEFYLTNLDEENVSRVTTDLLVAGKAKISTALIEDLFIGPGGNVTLSPDATISWEQITGTDEIAYRSDIIWGNLGDSPPDLLTQSELTAALTGYVTTGQMTDALANTLNLGNFSTIITRDYIASMNLIVGDEILMGANAHIGWLNVDSKPNFSSVATSGSYNDLSNKPSIPSDSHIEVLATNITADYLETPNLYTNIGTVYNLLRIGSPSSSSTQKSLYFNDSVNFTTQQQYIPGQYGLKLSANSFNMDVTHLMGTWNFTDADVTLPSGVSVTAKFG